VYYTLKLLIWYWLISFSKTYLLRIIRVFVYIMQPVLIHVLRMRWMILLKLNILPLFNLYGCFLFFWTWSILARAWLGCEMNLFYHFDASNPSITNSWLIYFLKICSWLRVIRSMINKYRTPISITKIILTHSFSLCFILLHGIFDVTWFQL